MRLDPCLQPSAIETAGGDVKNRLLRFIDRCLDAPAIEPKERDNGSVTDPLVAIHEWMVLDERETQRRRFGRQTRVKVLASKGLSRLRDCRFQCAKVAKQRLLATLFHDQTVED